MYFDGEICDETGSRRVYGFDGEVRRKLFEMQEKKETVDLVSCVVKKARGPSEDLEIMVNGATVCSASLRKVEPEALGQVKRVKVGTWGQLQMNTRYDICVEVLSSSDAEEAKPNLHKQELVVGDETGCARLVLWQNEIGMMEVDATVSRV